VRRWLKSKGDRPALAQYEASLAKDREIIRFLLQTRDAFGAAVGQPREIR
jgi:predicted aminopeptidase